MKEYIERVTALNALIRALGYCQCANDVITLSLIHISEPTRRS